MTTSPYNRDRYLANREFFLAKSKAYWAAHREERAEYNRANREKKREYNRAYQLAAYGLDQASFDALVHAQDATCAICGGPPSAKGWMIDHDHSTGAIRGLLCSRCNLLLGMVYDNADVLLGAVAYLRKER